MSNKEEIILKTLSNLIDVVDSKDFITSVSRDGDKLVILYASGRYVNLDMPLEIRGLDGIHGIDGINGTNGQDGIDGLNGVDGKDGRDGIHGEQGRPGKDGLNGKDGKDGRNGVDGKHGKNGSNGLDGNDGLNGEDGETIESVHVDAGGYLIVTTNKKEINAGLVRRKGGGGVGGGGAGFVDFRYSNSLPMPSDVGGFQAGTIFDRMSLVDLWNGLLYAYSKPTFTSFIIHETSLIYEVGDGIIEGEEQTDFTIANPELLEPNSIKIVYVNDETTIIDNLPNISPVNVYYPAVSFDTPTDCIFRISALDTNGDGLSRDFIIRFLSRIFVGESDLEVLEEADVEALRITQLKDNINGQYSMLAGGYKWFCYPQAMGTRLNFFDMGTGFEIAMDDIPLEITLTNAYGLVIPYYCYSSVNILHGAINIEVRP